jgi:DNA-binding NarL/FixJ family response regulator
MLRVVFADDSDLVRARLATLASDLAGVEVVAYASSAQEALDAIRRTVPDVVVLDVCMPGGSGIGALKVIKALEVPPVVIMLTAFPYPQFRMKCTRMGADHFLDKATEFDQVAEVLERLRDTRVADHATASEQIPSSGST